MWPCGTVVLHAIKGVQQNKTRQWHLVKGHSNFCGELNIPYDGLAETVRIYHFK